MLPGKESCEALLRAYLHHVHPIMPVIEVDSILDYQQNGRLHEYNILLLWSIFFAAVNVSDVRIGRGQPSLIKSQFVPQNVIIQEGFKSRKEMKATLYSRTKVRKRPDWLPAVISFYSMNEYSTEMQI